MKKRQAKKILLDTSGRGSRQIKLAARTLRKTCEIYKISVTAPFWYRNLGAIIFAFNKILMVVGFVDNTTFECVLLRRK